MISRYQRGILETTVRIVAALSISALSLATGLALAQNSVALDPNDPAVIADFRQACGEEIRQAEGASYPQGSVQATWVSLFRKLLPPGAFFFEITEAKQPRLDPLNYLRACAALTVAVQRKSGVGSGAQALTQWRELRALYAKQIADGSLKSSAQADDPKVLGGGGRP